MSARSRAMIDIYMKLHVSARPFIMASGKRRPGERWSHQRGTDAFVRQHGGPSVSFHSFSTWPAASVADFDLGAFVLGHFFQARDGVARLEEVAKDEGPKIEISD